MRKVLAILTFIGFILGTTHLALSSPPAIDLAEYGVAFWSAPDGYSLDFQVNVIDHDGTNNIKEVVVSFPQIYLDPYSSYNSLKLTAGKTLNGYTRVYYGSIYLPSDAPALGTRDYVFQATDYDDNTGEATETFTPNPINTISDLSLKPNNRANFIKAVFDEVSIRRNEGVWVPYDDFETGSLDLVTQFNPNGRWINPLYP